MGIFKYEEEKKQLIIDYMSSSFNKESGKQPVSCKLGPEIEHIMFDKKENKRVTYPGPDGVEGVLRDLLMAHPDWQGIYSHDHVIGIRIDPKKEGPEALGAEISLEPAGQFEISLDPSESVLELRDSYLYRIRQVYEVLDNRNYCLVNVGIDPVNKVLDLPMIPKDRYREMDAWMSKQGVHARTMMRLTASFQVSIDVFDESDFIRKYKILGAITPILYTLFDNSPYYEGRFVQVYNARQEVWRNVDPARSGLPENIFDEDFGLAAYAEKILQTPPIFFEYKGELRVTGAKTLSEILDQVESMEEAEALIEHGLSIVFPDIRMKKIMEIRSMDSVPAKYSFAAAALIKGLFYNEKNLAKLEKAFLPAKLDWIRRGQDAGRDNGLTAFYRGDYMVNWGLKFIDMAKEALDPEEAFLLEELRKLWDDLKTPRDLIEARTKSRANKKLSKDLLTFEEDDQANNKVEIVKKVIEKCEVINALS